MKSRINTISYSRAGLCLILGLVLSALSAAQNPFLGANEFPQFRQISGMSGGGYGLDNTGWGSLSGATAYSTPLGIAIGHDQVRVGGADTAFSIHHLPTSFEGSSYGTGKAFLTYGHSFGDWNLAYSYFIKSGQGDASTDLQLSYSRPGPHQPSYSVGVQDIVGDGGSAGSGIPGDMVTSRSLFGAISYPIALSPNAFAPPLWITAGYGSRRFGKGFASSSYQVWNPLRVWAEYDGYGMNEGILLAIRPSEKGPDISGEEYPVGQRSIEADLSLGFLRGRYPTAALTIGF